MKPNAIVVAEEVPEDALWYLTPGKEYEAKIDFASPLYAMALLNDTENVTYCLAKGCPHLNGKPWRIVKVMNVMEVKL